MGLSDRVASGTLEERMDDVRAVMDAVGSERAALIGVSEGGPISMLFAATYPERTEALILCGAEVKEEMTDDWPWGECDARGVRGGDASAFPSAGGIGGGASCTWPRASRAIRGAPRRGRGRLADEAETPGDAIAFMRMAFEIDVRDVVPSVDVPTLVVHRTGDRDLPRRERALARRAHSRARATSSSHGDDHVPWVGERRTRSSARSRSS